MARTREVARRSTGEPIPKKPCTTSKSNKCEKRPPTPSRSSSESESSKSVSEKEPTADKINPRKRPCTAPKSKRCAKRPEPPSSSSESESSQDEESSPEPEPKSSSSESECSQDEGSSSEPEPEPEGDKINSRKRPCTTPSGTRPSKRPPKYVPSSSSESEENEADSPAPVDGNEVNDREISREEHDRTLKERDVALNELNSLRAKVKELQNYRSKDLAEFEMGKKVWEAEKKGLNERLDREFSRSAAELKKAQESLSKSKAELQKSSQARDSYKNSLIFAKKTWDEEKKALTAGLNNEVLNNNSRALAEFESGKKVLEGEKKALTERLDKEFSNFAAKLKEVLENLSKSNAELEWTQLGRDSYRNSLELGKEWEAEKKALTERLNTVIINFGAELKQVLKNLSKSEAELEKTSKERDTCKNSLELGNKVWETERIEMAKKIEMANKEKKNALELGKKLANAERIETAESIALANKEKEKAYCKGYLDGWLQKPHAYVQAWHDARLTNEVSDVPVMQKMNNLPKSHV